MLVVLDRLLVRRRNTPGPPHGVFPRTPGTTMVLRHGSVVGFSFWNLYSRLLRHWLNSNQATSASLDPLTRSAVYPLVNHYPSARTLRHTILVGFHQSLTLPHTFFFLSFFLPSGINQNNHTQSYVRACTNSSLSPPPLLTLPRETRARFRAKKKSVCFGIFPGIARAALRKRSAALSVREWGCSSGHTGSIPAVWQLVARQRPLLGNPVAVEIGRFRSWPLTDGRR